MTISREERRPRGRRPGQNRAGQDAILAAAIPWFGRYGFEGTSLRQLAKDADVDVALIGHFFGSKLGLWQACLQELSKEFHQDSPFFESLRAPSPLSARFDLLLEWVIRRCRARPFFGIIVMREALIGLERLQMLVDILLRPLYGELKPFLDELIASGDMACDDSTELFTTLFDSVASRIASENLQKAILSTAQKVDERKVSTQLRKMLYRKI